MEGAAATSGDRVPTILLSTAQMIKYRDERKTLIFALVGGQSLEGFIKWFDVEAVHIMTEERGELTVMKSAILYFGAKAA